MHNNATRQLATLSALLLLALSPLPAAAVLERVGPNDPVNTLPVWFQDKTGITFELCTPLNQAELDGGYCLLLPGDTVAPEVFPAGFFDEHFFWGADVVGNWTYTPAVGQTVPFTTSRVVYVQAIEAAFLTGVRPGGADMFGRVRFRMDDLPLTGNYTFYTPYGIEVIPGTAGDRIFFTEDIGCGYPGYECVLQTRIGPFLLPSLTPGGAELPPIDGPVPGKKYIADPAVTHKVTGSPIVGNYTLASGRQVNPNGLYIEAPDGQLVFESNDFSLMGRYYGDVIPSRLKVDRASYSRDENGIAVDAFATGEPTMVPRLSAAAQVPPVQPQLSIFAAPCAGGLGPQGEIIPPFGAPAGHTAVPMSRSGNIYWAETAAPAIPAGVCLADLGAQNAQGQVVPVYVPGTLGDQVFVTAAVFDPTNGGSLSVRASSSDYANPPVLSLGAFGDLLANVPLTDDLAYVTPLAAPPSKVRVLSQEGGVAELQVKIGSRAATGVSLTADKSSPQPPGTAVVFTAQGAGAAEYLYRFWLHDGSSWAVAQDWSANATWVLPAATAPGSYQVKVDVWAGLQPTAPDATSTVVPFAITVLPATGVLVSSSLPSPQVPGTSVTFTAAGVGSSSPYSYRFWLFDGATWTVTQDWSLTATWAMPTGSPAGTYQVVVQVRTSAAALVDAASTPLVYVLENPPATGVTLTPSLAPPQAPGTEVLWTAAGQGSTAAYSYRFWLNAAGAWAIVQDWSATATWTMPAALAAGDYEVAVEVRTSPTVYRDAISPYVPFSLSLPAPPPATGVSLTPSPASPQIPGTDVLWTAAGQGSTAAYSYRFWLNTAGAWAIVQDWSATATWTMSGALPAGAYEVAVEVRTSPAVYRDAISPYVGYLIQDSPPPPATGVTLTSSLPTPQALGTEVLWTAAGEGSTAPYTYRFWLNTAGGWAVIQDWSSATTWTMPGSLPVGYYQVAVEVRTTAAVARDAVSPYALYQIQ